MWLAESGGGGRSLSNDGEARRSRAEGEDKPVALEAEGREMPGPPLFLSRHTEGWAACRVVGGSSSPFQVGAGWVVAASGVQPGLGFPRAGKADPSLGLALQDLIGACAVFSRMMHLASPLRRFSGRGTLPWYTEARNYVLMNLA